MSAPIIDPTEENPIDDRADAIIYLLNHTPPEHLRVTVAALLRIDVRPGEIEDTGVELDDLDLPRALLYDPNDYD